MNRLLKGVITYFLISVVSIFTTIILFEIYLRNLDDNFFESSNKEKFLYNKNLGWIYNNNLIVERDSDEFDYHLSYTNNIGLNHKLDFVKENYDNVEKILVLGDSHTSAIGVDTENNWVSLLNKYFKTIDNNIVFFNAGTEGYNLDQYYFSFKRYKEIVKPTKVIIAFSSATDFYDVGKFSKEFIYGKNIGRSFFEIENDNKLILNTSLENIENIENVFSNSDNQEKSTNFSQYIKNLLYKTKLFWFLKGSKLSYWLASKLRFENFSIWPGIELALKKELNYTENKKLILVEKIIQKIKNEAEQIGAELYLLHIPYMVEIYDDIWNLTYKNNINFQIDIGEKKLKIISNILDIKFIETRSSLNDHHRKFNQNLHFIKDGHMNETGHKELARIIIQYFINNK